MRKRLARNNNSTELATDRLPISRLQHSQRNGWLSSQMAAHSHIQSFIHILNVIQHFAASPLALGLS